MKTDNSDCKHPVPFRYHKSLYIGELDRRGNRIDFKVPPVVVQSPKQISEYKQQVFAEHVDAESLPMIYDSSMSFMILRPTALHYRNWVREEIECEGLSIHEEIEMNNFMHFADTLYFLDPDQGFHWRWRVIMRILHESGVQDQNKAVVFTVNNDGNHNESHDRLVTLKKRMRHSMGETPVIVKRMDSIELALGIHHLHVPEFERLRVEYNTLMHARSMTSIFDR